MCNAWKEYRQCDGVLSDIMDGKVLDFFNNRPFLDAPNSLGLALNIDWFNPYEHMQYSNIPDNTELAKG